MSRRTSVNTKTHWVELLPAAVPAEAQKMIVKDLPRLDLKVTVGVGRLVDEAKTKGLAAIGQSGNT